MKIDPKRFRFVLTLQTILVLLDLTINTFSIACKNYNSVVLIFFILQDVCLILSLGLLLLTFFSTYVFQAGLVELLYDKFRVTIAICIFYFIVTTVLYIWILCVQYSEIQTIWSYWFLSIYSLQRFASTVYYYFYKRAAMKICDPRFYEDMILWDQNRLGK